MNNNEIKLFGRDDTVKSIWARLEEKSILLTAERRMGKTEVLKALEREHAENYIVIYSDISKVSSPIGFVNDVLRTLTPYLTSGNKAKRLINNLKEQFGGTEIAGILKLPDNQNDNWNELLSQIITNACENNHDKTILFLWDEIPYMLQKIEALSKGGSYSGLELLDTLRAFRMEKPNLRMIFTGSIGLHHVVKALKKDTLASCPTNDMDKIDLPKLTPVYAKEMAKYRILEKEKLLAESEIDDDLLTAICEECDFMPYYIEQALKQFAIKNKELTTESFKAEVAQILVGGMDNWELEHFRVRLVEYYTGDINEHAKNLLAREILSHIAVSDSPQSAKACFQALNARFQLDDSAQSEVIELLRLLVKDHYLTKIHEQGHQFTFSFIKRWWIEAEELY